MSLESEKILMNAYFKLNDALVLVEADRDQLRKEIAEMRIVFDGIAQRPKTILFSKCEKIWGQRAGLIAALTEIAKGISGRWPDGRYPVSAKTDYQLAREALKEIAKNVI